MRKQRSVPSTWWIYGFEFVPRSCLQSIFRNVKINTIKLKRCVMNFFPIFRLFSDTA